jgi:hypothetical protein
MYFSAGSPTIAGDIVTDLENFAAE